MSKRIDSKVAGLKEALNSKGGQPPLSHERAISSGSTLLNLACTDRGNVAFAKGGYYYFVGDSRAGKTWLSFSLFAEACRNGAFQEHELVYDDVEGGALMDVERYFGKDVVARVRSPWKDKEGPRCSETVEDFYHQIFRRIEAGKPFIYVLDSQDALGSEAANKKLAKQRKSRSSQESVAGSYGDGKAKYHSEHLRLALSGIRKTGSILIIIGQTRDNLGFGFEKKTRAGGKALRFYANLEIWMSVVGKATKAVRGKPRTIGTICKAEVKKNRVTGKTGSDRAVEIPIHYGLGIDDVGGCIDFLVAWHWTKNKGTITAEDFDFTGSRTALIRLIEEGNMETKLRRLTQKVWRQLEEEAEPKRKPRYS